MNSYTANEILQRLEQLERENRRIRSSVKCALMLLMLLIGPLLYVGCQSRRGTITGQEIVLTDPEGHVRAKLSVPKTGYNCAGCEAFSPTLEFFDGRGAKVSSVSEAGLSVEYGGRRGSFTGSGISLSSDKSQFLLSDYLLQYSRADNTFTILPSEQGISLNTKVKESEFGALVKEGSASVFVASPQGGEIDLNTDQTGTRIGRFPASAP